MIETMFNILFYPGILLVLVLSILYFGILRKLAAVMQNRVGPPIIQPVYDIIKLFGKEGVVPHQSGYGFSIWPVISLSSVLIVSLIVPIVFSGLISFNGDLIFVLYMLVLSSLAYYLSGFSSGNPFGIHGAIRGIVQMIAYEIVLAMSIVVVAVVNNSASIVYNSNWLINSYPLAGFGFLLAFFAKIEMPPFHIPGSHQEIVAGSTAEYTGSRLAILELAHMIKTFVLIALMVSLYLGGASSLLIFVLKSIFVLFVILISRVIFARLKINQAVNIYWMSGIIVFIDLFRVIFF
ncbi:MAG: NADH-quinone oxidoreductase subunit H [DPANN group archaeon]|nr:NADH-quinone oxidoreductase subunit H [DPANN group archaeon]